MAVERVLSWSMGLLLFVGGMAIAICRAMRNDLVSRLIPISGTSVSVLMANVESAVSSMGSAFTVILIIAIIEQRTLKLNEVEAPDSIG